jgi:5'-nucleotidase
MKTLVGLSIVLLVGLTPLTTFGKTILLTNDDGYQAPGITALYKALTAANHDVILVAPATQQSSASASISSSGVKLVKHTDTIYSVTGRPADAVRIGLSEVMNDKKPDLVISGANFGQNSGRDVMVSGTVGAAATAHALGFPAIAISVEIKFSELEQRFPSTIKVMGDAADVVVALLASKAKLPENAILNINYPAVPKDQVRGVVATTISNYSLFSGSYRTLEDGSLRANYNFEPPAAPGTDAYELSRGYVTVTRLDGAYGMSTNRSLRKLASTLESAVESAQE